MGKYVIVGKQEDVYGFINEYSLGDYVEVGQGVGNDRESIVLESVQEVEEVILDEKIMEEHKVRLM